MHLMGNFALLAASSWTDPEWYWQLFLVALGLGAVIFVHELGHFLVAKACGVKCEKFYIGFDIGGWKLFKYKWGETEYGIGVLPLGGYVKMLGQEDNPSRVAEELERAKQSGTGDSGEPTFQLDPRSYLAKSVPQRMAIISAGVIMNVIFAWIFASIAYGLGVQYSPAVIGGLVPGEAAWQAGLQVGDEITQIGNQKKPRFQDLMTEVTFGDIENGVPLIVKRPGVGEPLSITVYPERKEGSIAPRIGIRGAVTHKLSDDSKGPTIPGTPASDATPSFERRDTIVAINGEPVTNYAELHSQLAKHPDDTLTCTVERKLDKDGKPTTDKERIATTRRIQISVAPNPLLELGLSMKMGPILAVQPDSPAAEAGVKPGDLLLAIDGEPAGDPLRLADRLRRRAGETVQLKLRRADQAEPVEVSAKLRLPKSYDAIEDQLQPYSAPALGIAYAIQNEVTAVAVNGPAEKAGIKPGDVVTAVKFIEPPDSEDDVRKLPVLEFPYKVKTLSWPYIVDLLQRAPIGTQVELTLKDGRQVTLQPTKSSEWHTPVRGLLLEQLSYTRTAESVGEALSLGGRETKDSLLMVVRFLRKIGTQISPTAMGGLGSIFTAATSSAEQGPAQLLIFLCVLSANLAVINMLPIPVLDGGHMVFLAYEGLFRKPVPEKWFLIATYAGFMFVLGLLLFANGLDVWRWIT